MSRQIARLTVTEGKIISRGTGFLVARDHLLTAFHVVGDRPNGVPFTSPVEVAFEGGDATFPTSAVIATCDADADWALLKLAHDVTTVEPIALRVLRSGSGDPWSSFGFANGKDAPGMAYEGTVSSNARRIQLDCRQAHANARVPGLSGAPCIVDDCAVGIIISVSDPVGSGYPVDGAMFAVSIERVTAAIAWVKALLPRWPPFVPDVESELVAAPVVPLLPQVALLGPPWRLPDVAIAERPRLAPLVAEKILRSGGPARAVPALKKLYKLGLGPSYQILNFTALASIDDAIAAKIETAVAAAQPRTIIGLNLAKPALGARYVHRAGYWRAAHPGWRETLGELSEPASEGRAGELVRLAREAMLRPLGCDRDDELDDAYREHDHAAAPIVLVIPPPMPPAAGVDDFHAAFPMVRLVILCGAGGLPELLARFPRAVECAAPDAGKEDGVAREHDEARLAMHRFYDKQLKEPP